jgi:hypothetical protein
MGDKNPFNKDGTPNPKRHPNPLRKPDVPAGNDMPPKIPTGGDRPPRDPLFDKAHGRSNYDPSSAATRARGLATPEERAQLEQLMPGFLARMRADADKKGRAERVLPYLLVRSFVGDRGDRPWNRSNGDVFWESPDIWTAVGDPSVTPEIPSAAGGRIAAGEPNTLYAHVWNLGRAPIVGAKVEFYVCQPAFLFDESRAQKIGFERVDLAPRSSLQCHKLVKCKTAWTPAADAPGHECIVVRVSGVGDGISAANPWEPWADRHIAQRNISVVGTSAASAPDPAVQRLLESLEANRTRGLRVELSQVGREGRLAVGLLAPELSLDTRVQTHVLAELRADGSMSLPARSRDNTASPTGPFDVPRLVPSDLLGAPTGGGLRQGPQRTTKLGRGDSVAVVPQGGDLHTLFAHASFLTPELRARIEEVERPLPNQAQVLRFSSYRGDQLVGGYTLILEGR